MGLPKVKKHVAKFDLYERGLKIANPDRKSGFTHTFRQPADADDKVLIPKGFTYYEWHRKRMPVQRSLEYPVFPILKSEHQEKIEEFEERKENLSDAEERDSLADDVESYKDELQERLDRIPDQLQESSVLNERIEEMDSLASEIREMEFDEDEEE